MASMCREISEWISAIAERLYPGSLEGELVVVTPSTQRQFGHYQCNHAMRLAGKLRLAPRQIAQSLTEELLKMHAFEFVKVEVAGPGFINLTLSDNYLCQRVGTFDRAFIAKAFKQERVLIDFSGPNTAKEMHVGHLRSTIIGDCLARIYEFLNFDVLRVNHIGDWGTQFGMLIAWILRYEDPHRIEAIVHPERELPSVLPSRSWDLPFLMNIYQQSKKLFDNDMEFATEAKAKVVDLQSHEPKTLAIWKHICDISRKAYQEIYDILDIRIQECGESFYNDQLPEIVQDLTHREFITPSEGAKCVFLEGYDIPLMVQKSDGGYNYDTTDLAAMRYRCHQLKAKRIAILTDAGQKLHFELIFKAARLVGYLPDDVQVDHVPFGLVLGPDGKKFKTRSGQTEKLVDLIRAAIDQAKALLIERGETQGEALESLAKALGINAIKYADLSTYRLSDYSFSYEKMLRFEGNTAAFLMYAYVRSLGILRRQTHLLSTSIRLTHESERQLLLTILQFDEALERTLEDLAPNRLAEYLYTLAQDFNAFFRDCRVEGSDEQASRLALVALTSKWLGQGLELLGLKLVEKM